MTTIRVITVATQAKNPSSPQSYFEQFKASWRRHGVEPVILGWGRPFPRTWAKLKYLEEYLADHKDFNYLLFCDALDTVTSASAEAVLERFLAHYDENSVVFSGEKNCWPNKEKAERYPPGTGEKYLNSGLWMGRRLSAVRLISLMNSETKYAQNDQASWTDMYLEQKSPTTPVVVDRKCHLFQSLCSGSIDDLMLDGESIRNKVTGTNPLIFHGNGSTPMEKILKWLKL